MTKQLEEALAAASQLPETEQDAIATQIIEKVARLGIATPTISSSDIESLERLYTFREQPEVLQFIEKYPFLLTILLEAHRHISKYFPDSPLFLEVVTDSEATSPDEDILWVYIATKLDDQAAIDMLERLDDDWWLNAESRSQGKMFIGLDRL